MTLLKNSPYPRNAQFPGLNKQTTISKIREMVKDSEKIVGYRIAIPVGSSGQASLPLPGEARILLGFKLAGNVVNLSDVSMSVKLNNEVIVDTVAAQIFSVKERVIERYIPVPRPLSGSDSLTISFDNGDGVGYVGVFLNVFYI